MGDDIEAPFSLDDIFQGIVDRHSERVDNVIKALKTIGIFIERCHQDTYGYDIEVPLHCEFGDGITDYCSITIELKNDDFLFDTNIAIYPFDADDHAKGKVEISTTAYDRESGVEKRAISNSYDFFVLTDAKSITNQILLLLVTELPANDHGVASSLLRSTFSDQIKQYSPSKANSQGVKIPDFDY